MKKLSLAAITLLSLLLSVQGAFAAAREWALDPAHSNVYFGVDHIYSKVQGRFSDLAATIRFDRANLKESSFAFKIKVESIDTGIGKRDKHLLSPDFFDSGKFPLVTFTSSEIVDAGQGVYQVKGTLNIMGKDHDLTVPLTFAGIKEHPAEKGKQVIGFNGRFTVDRLALGVGDGKFHTMGLVGKDVEVLVTLEALAGK